MARRRSVVRRAGAGRRVTPGAILATLLVVGAAVIIGFRVSAMRGGDDATAAVGQAATGPFRAGENVFTRVGAMWNSTQRVQQLEAENRDLRAWRALAERLAERNQRYEALLRMPPDSFGEGADTDHSIAAQLVLDSGGPFTRSLVANAGADHGVKIGYIAINENGLIGRVVSIGRRSARVLMLDDYSSRIPVMGEASRVRAVLAGQATQAPSLLTGPYQVQAPRLDFIVGAQSLREGERIVTSGDGGLYPRGIAVGTARRAGDGAWRVELAASKAPIDFVRLVPYVGAVAPESEPAPDAGPPPSARSSVAAIGHETMAPTAPMHPLTLVDPNAPPRPRPTPSTTTAAAAPTTTTAPATPPATTPTAPQPAPAQPPG